MLAGWENFYFLIGSAGAGLIGLLFVVVTLTAGFDSSRTMIGFHLYMAPTAFHFGAVLTMSGIAVAPQLPELVVPAMFTAAAVAGLVVAARAGRGISGPLPAAAIEPPHWSDVWTYAVMPGAIYLAVIADAAGLWRGWPPAPIAMAALLMALLLVGVRNAWDLVTWIAPRTKDPARQG